MTAAPTCPHCFAPVRGDGRPTCLCAAAEAEDFDPLRLRPYVALPDRVAGPDEGGEGGTAPCAGPGAGPDPGPGGEQDRLGSLDSLDSLEDLPGVDAAVHRFSRPAGPTSRTFHTSGPLSGPLSDPLSGPLSGPLMEGETSASFPEGATSGPFPGDAASGPFPEDTASGPLPRVAASDGSGPPAGRRRTRSALLTAAGTAVTAVTAAAIVVGTGLLPDGDRDRAAPPDRGTSAPTTAVPTTAAPASPTPTPVRPSPATSRSRAPGTLPHPSRSPAPPLPPPVRASGSVAVPSADASPSTAPTGPIVLREGSSGPEVLELQGRLRQLAIYTGAVDGQYGAEVRDAVARYQRTYGVHDDPDGVYGAATRASLEARTQQP
ncbi:putative peptidoglycan binding protein [Streptomyces noursei ATCC 11455]|nr:putative peptidoglycan binding protein [Streptomyces noursei ATCC 11455]